MTSKEYTTSTITSDSITITTTNTISTTTTTTNNNNNNKNNNNGKQVMPELAFELEEIFRTRLFSFPLDDHESAREIFRYLLDKGVPEDELAHVIQASTNSMTLWLCRTGLKRMVGEWIISWINKCYNQYLTSEAIGRLRENSNEDRLRSCFDENCLSPKDADRRSKTSDGSDEKETHPIRARSPSRSETEGCSGDAAFLLFGLNAPTDHPKGLQPQPPPPPPLNPRLHLHLACKNFLSLLRRGGDVIVSLRKFHRSPEGGTATSTSTSRPRPKAAKVARSAYARSNSFPSDWKWKHLKSRTEYSRLRADKRDSGIVEDLMESLPSDVCPSVHLPHRPLHDVRVICDDF